MPRAAPILTGAVSSCSDATTRPQDRPEEGSAISRLGTTTSHNTRHENPQTARQTPDKSITTQQPYKLDCAPIEIDLSCSSVEIFGYVRNARPIPRIHLNGRPLNLNSPETFSFRPLQHQSPPPSPPSPRKPKLNSVISSETRPPYEADFFRLPAQLHRSDTNQPLTLSLLLSLIPALIKWRYLTFYGPFPSPEVQAKFADEAYLALALRAPEFAEVNWLDVCMGIQRRDSEARKAGQRSSPTRFGEKTSRFFGGRGGPERKTPEGGCSESMSVCEIVERAAKTLGIPRLQIEIAIWGLAVATAS
jgi:hypothetical protein